MPRRTGPMFNMNVDIMGLVNQYRVNKKRERVAEAVRTWLPRMRDPAYQTSVEDLAKYFDEKKMEPDEIMATQKAIAGFNDWEQKRYERQQIRSMMEKMQGGQGPIDPSLLQRFSTFADPQNAYLRQSQVDENQSQAFKYLMDANKTQAEVDELDERRKQRSIFGKLAEELGLNAPDAKPLSDVDRQRVGLTAGAAGMRGWESLIKPNQGRALGLGDPGYNEALKQKLALEEDQKRRLQESQARLAQMAAVDKIKFSNIQKGLQGEANIKDKTLDDATRQLRSIFGQETARSWDAEKEQQYSDASALMARKIEKGMDYMDAATEAHWEVVGARDALKNLPTAKAFKPIHEGRIRRLLETENLKASEVLESLVAKGWKKDEALAMLRRIAEGMDDAE